MFEISSRKGRIDRTEYTESRNVDYIKNTNRFLNISPKNYIKAMKDMNSKKSMIPMMLISIMDKNNRVMMTLDELSEVIEYPKTSLSVVFGELRKNEFMVKERNGVYMVNPLVSYKGSKYERDKLLEEYNAIMSRDKKERGY